MQITHLFPKSLGEIFPSWMENVFQPTCFTTWPWVLLLFKQGRLSVSKGLPASVAEDDWPQYLSLSGEADRCLKLPVTPLQMVAVLGKVHTGRGSTELDLGLG